MGDMREHFREALERLDIPLVRKIAAHVMPQYPVSQDDADALVSAHMARTGIPQIRFRLRAYSHAWLLERGLPSQLPDNLRPRAERIYPVSVPAVGIAVKNRHAVALLIRQAMLDAVADAGVHDSVLTKRAIMSARAKARRQLLGIVE
jgi:hypothetical protein